MANRVRGEVEITLDGKRYTMRPEFDAIASIESETGMGVLKLARLIASGDGISLNTFTTIIYHGVRVAVRGTRPPTREMIGEALLRAGLSAYTAAVSDFLLSVIAGTEGKGEGEETPPPPPQAGALG